MRYARAAAELPGTIQPITFAAPTAGNSQFADLYDALFPTARRFQNSLDVIPLAYYDLDAIDSIYGRLARHAGPRLARLAGMEAAIDHTGASYAQPAQGQQILHGHSPADA